MGTGNPPGRPLGNRKFTFRDMKERFPIRIHPDKCGGRPHVNGSHLEIGWAFANLKTPFLEMSKYYPGLEKQQWDDLVSTLAAFITAYEENRK